MTLLNPVIMEELLNFDALEDFAADQEGPCASYQAIQTIISREITRPGEELNQAV